LVEEQHIWNSVICMYAENFFWQGGCCNPESSYLSLPFIFTALYSYLKLLLNIDNNKIANKHLDDYCLQNRLSISYMGRSGADHATCAFVFSKDTILLFLSFQTFNQEDPNIRSSCST
jgi:hypothetical protein